nr:hypothetical protein [uncultured Novosphingobium sp.]
MLVFAAAVLADLLYSARWPLGGVGHRGHIAAGPLLRSPHPVRSAAYQRVQYDPPEPPRRGAPSAGGLGVPMAAPLTIVVFVMTKRVYVKSILGKDLKMEGK